MLLRQVPAQPTPPGLASSRRWLTRPQKRAGDAASTAPPRLTRCSSSGGRADGGAGASRGGQQHDAAEPAGAAPQLRDLQLQMWEAKKRMERCAQAGEYAEAAAARDQLRALELRSRQLELQALADARATVLFSIGQVIQHKRYGYRGVIVGYDPTCQAAEEWIKTMRVDWLPGGRSQPFYHVLVDVRDRPGGQTTYVAQENAQPLRVPREVAHPLTDRLFAAFDPASGYLAGPELKAAYPADF